jgi:hypothetical protein
VTLTPAPRPSFHDREPLPSGAGDRNDIFTGPLQSFLNPMIGKDHVDT